MSKRFMAILEQARAEKRITPESYILLKCGTVVENILMQMTNGDESNITVETLTKILESIGEEKKLEFEKERKVLSDQIAQQENEIQDLRKSAEERDKEQNVADERERRRAARAESFSGWIVGIGMILAITAAGCVVGALLQKLALCVMVSVAVMAIELWRLGSSWSLIGLLRRAVARKLKEM